VLRSEPETEEEADDLTENAIEINEESITLGTPVHEILEEQIVLSDEMEVNEAPIYSEEDQWKDDLDLPPLHAKIERPKKPILEKTRKDKKPKRPAFYLLLLFAVLIIGGVLTISLFYNSFEKLLLSFSKAPTEEIILEKNEGKSLKLKEKIKETIQNQAESTEKEVIQEANLLPAPWRYVALQKRFINMLPKDYHFIQMIHDPFVYVSPTNRFYYYQGYYLPEISRITGFADLDRTGKYILYGDTTEFLLSMINDDVYRAALKSARYFDGNGVDIPGKNLKTFDRWDYYIKPIIYGKYWGDELIYFPKYRGYENIEYLGVKAANVRKHAIHIPYEEIIDFLKTPGGIVKRHYENVPLE